jgi:hypothetical protein
MGIHLKNRRPVGWSMGWSTVIEENSIPLDCWELFGFHEGDLAGSARTCSTTSVRSALLRCSVGRGLLLFRKPIVTFFAYPHHGRHFPVLTR